MTIGLLNLTITTPVLEIDSIFATGGIRKLLSTLGFNFFFASSSNVQPVQALSISVDSYNYFISFSTSVNDLIEEKISTLLQSFKLIINK
jgi:hypothetical protein